MNFFGSSKKLEEKELEPEPEPVIERPVVVATPQPAARPIPAPVIQEPPPRPAYGIQEAIMLMRTVQIDKDVELVVSVIKSTLESLKVQVSDIIDDASRRQADIENRVSDLKHQIAEFDAEIATRRDEIGRLEADHAETSTVKERLELAERISTGPTVTKQPRSRNRATTSGVPSMEPARVMMPQGSSGEE